MSQFEPNSLTVVTENKALVTSTIQLPVLVENSGEEACHRFLEYFVAQIRNKNTREAYRRAVYQFMDWCVVQGATTLKEISYMHVSAYIEQHPASKATVLQHLAGIRQLFAWLYAQRIIDRNPAENVRGPKHRVKKGKTPVLEREEMRQLLDSFKVETMVGLRDRALIALMTYTFGRVSAIVGMNVEDYFQRGPRQWVRLHEKGGKFLEEPLHHTADEYLHAYLDAAGQQPNTVWDKDSPIFRSLKPGGARRLSNRRLDRRDAWAMVKRRADDAGLTTVICNHTFRGTGITNYLENGGNRDTAQEMAGHADVRTTALYDRRNSSISLDEIEKIRF